MLIKILLPTILKRKTVPSGELPDDQKQELEAGKEYAINSWAVDGTHVRVAFLKENFKGFNTWNVFGKHCEIWDDGKKLFPVAALPASVKLNVPYKSQLDNVENPSGSCNVTAVATVITYLGFKPKGSEQLEDVMYRQMLDKGWSRHSPFDLKKLVEFYGYKDDFDEFATIDKIKRSLANGKPVIVHAYLTVFGHIVTIVGHNKTGFLVHDSYGEYSPSGYRTDLSGAYVHYSYDLMKRVCLESDGSWWAHFISK